MTEQNPFNKRHIEEVSPSQRTLLDELHLPPRVRSFLEENGNYIKAGLLVIIVLVAAWSFYDYYTAKQKEEANALLFKAVNQGNPTASQQMMEELRQQYSSTGAAVWSRVIVAQRQFASDNYQEAIKQYEAVINEEGEDSPLYPLLVHGLALAYESSGQYDKAIANFQILQGEPGFVSSAYFGLARSQEALGRIDEARENYKQVESAEETPSSLRQFIDYKLTTI